ncbi:MAG: aspartate-semialdehyde dehydrogenase [Gammaproteobacteria bacterium]|uniref:Aspartate-semialdehyde dehydrogenase n=1 Tax=endosymbiont of Bathymodiolus septemdierum str. Myojin knoll TaxID=1303921 RepID=A0A0P0UQ81_9GAMM|nr:aspartate-semialdehyde dehydrogenase [Bathymodiolus septemdierum thioautotrophic gill symbiont]RUA05144.1 MAG: aspartate-semialdehyde dehydrogenase [Gammaproteobacteria bacterium]BAS67204.1 aspartate-semialdehyde dehydrogenase [endosymbiont of Bathymodiolus septemdierum str. Myojin knoll]
MSKKFDVCVVGATGAVGETILSILEQRNFPINNLYPLASSNSAGKKIMCQGKTWMVQDLATFDFSQAQIGLFSAGGHISEKYAPIAAQAGCVVIDNTAHFRRDEDIPLVVPEVNPHAIAGYTKRNIIANPNCSTIQMLVALKPIYDAVGIERINVATYQAVSGSGKEAISELTNQAVNLLNGKEVDVEVYPKQIAFNVIPHIDVFQDNGYTKEEMKMVWETKKIFEDEDILVNPTAVRVPVLYGHSEAINIETKTKITAAEATAILEKADGVKVMDVRGDGGYATPFVEATNHDETFVSRIREDISHEKGLNLWVVSDNIRKGAALNSIQIAEILIEKYL